MAYNSTVHPREDGKWNGRKQTGDSRLSTLRILICWYSNKILVWRQYIFLIINTLLNEINVWNIFIAFVPIIFNTFICFFHQTIRPITCDAKYGCQVVGQVVAIFFCFSLYLHLLLRMNSVSLLLTNNLLR